MRSGQMIALALALTIAVPAAQAETVKMSKPVIRLGVMNDASGPNAALSGEGSVIGARMASLNSAARS